MATDHGPGSSDAADVRLRRIEPTDTAALQAFYVGLSPESRRRRFFAVAASLSTAQSDRFCSPDHHHREGFVAVDVAVDPVAPPIVGHLCLEPDGLGRAEVAIAVADAYQGRGIGRRLVAAGIAWARREGIARLTATMLADNGPIARLLAATGCPSRITPAADDLASLVMELDVPGRAAA